VRAECARAAAAYRLALPRRTLAGRAGERLGRAAGASLEFMDYRDYRPGDDLRHVDWAAYARTDQLKVRLHREEVSPSVDLVVDASPSMVVSEAKRQAVVDLVDAVVDWTRRAGGSPRRLAGGAEAFEAWSEVAWDAPDDGWPRAALRPRAMRFLVSDFLRPADPAVAVRRLAAQASHCAVLQVLDPWEADPSPDGPLTLLDCEDGRRLDLVLDEATATRYRRRLQRLCASVEAATRALGATYALVKADAPARMFREQLLVQGIVEPA
jgi:uncharacterized protein (DUF58 family)